MSNKAKTILSGIQPSGMIHLGNYFGAMKQFLEYQENAEKSYIFIANYHAMTTVKDKKTLLDNTLDIAMYYLAIGLDPERVNLFVQSDVPEVTELSWIFSTFTPMGLLERCHSYKDKLAKGFSPDHGLFAYPVLMAADILIYRPDLVPVGKDQKQHVEVARDIALKFNNIYGEYFPVPDVSIQKTTANVIGIDGQKMSKSYGNYICPFLPEKELKKQIMSIVTDSAALEDPKDPESCNVYKIYSLFADDDELRVLSDKYRAGGYGYGHAKKELLSKVLEYFDGPRKKYEDLKNNMDYVYTVLKEGGEKAREKANETMIDVRKLTGIYRS